MRGYFEIGDRVEVEMRDGLEILVGFVLCGRDICLGGGLGGVV